MNISLTLLAVTFGAASLGSAANITYTVNLTIGAGGVTGFIKTDGSTGALGPGNILDWNLLLNSTTSFDLLGPLSGSNSFVGFGDLFGHGNFTGTATQLLYNFSVGGTSFLAFESGSGAFGGTTLCFATEDCIIAGHRPGESLLINNQESTFQFTSESGTQAIGNVASTAAPEPSILEAFGIGIVFLGLRKSLRL